VIVHAQVVVNRLGNMKNAQIISLLLRQFTDNARGVG